MEINVDEFISFMKNFRKNVNEGEVKIVLKWLERYQLDKADEYRQTMEENL